MADESKCPACREEVPEAMLTSAYGAWASRPLEDGGSTMNCPKCGASLVRVGPGDPWEPAKP